MGADSEGLDRHNLAPTRQLDDWLRTKVALNVHHEDTKQLLPEFASDVAEQVEAGAQILALSTLHFHTDKRDPMPILARSWKLAEGRAKCEHARPGVIVLGDDRGGRVLRVCIEKKRRTKHWGQAPGGAGHPCDWRCSCDCFGCCDEADNCRNQPSRWTLPHASTNRGPNRHRQRERRQGNPRS